MPEVTRRELLAGIAGAGVAALTGCTAEYPGPETVTPVPEGWNRGEERWVSTICGQCEAGCGIRVRVHEGRAIKIEGNTDHPVNRGGVGPKGQCGLQLLYHPDRIREPLRRDGAKGSGGWTPVSWEEAIREIADRLADLRSRSGPQGLVVSDGEPRGMMRQLWDRFLAAYGSPNHLSHESAVYGGKVRAMAAMHGVADLPAYDWKATQYVLGLGAGLFESWCQSIHLTRTSSHWRRGTPGHRVKFVHVAPRFSVTSAKADEWIPIEPATYGALALGLAHVLVEEGLYDKEFVRDRTFGFEEWTDEAGRTHRGYKNLVLEDYSPEKVAPITGVPAETIVRIAREMAEHRPAISLADGGAAAATNGLGTAMAIHALNALLGNLERPGGMLVQKTAPLTPWKDVKTDEIAQNGLASARVDGAGTARCPFGRGFVQGAPEAILSGTPYPVQALFLYHSNPAFSKPDGARWVDVLKKVPLVVSFSPLPDESTLWADYVLPDHTYLERWEVVEPVPSVGYPVLGLRRPVVEPLHNSRASGDVLIELAKALGEPVSAAFPWQDYRQAALERLKGVVEIEKLEQGGGWWLPDYAFEQWDTAFPTPSRKFEFYSQAIAARLAALFPDEGALEEHLRRAGVTTRGDDLCLPHWEPPHFAGEPDDYPFVLVAYRAINYAEGGVRHLPFLREIPGAGRRAWRERVELNPRDADRLGLTTGDTVRVESSAGERRLCVVVEPGIRPGTVAIPLGHGVWPPSTTDATPTGGYCLLANQSDPLGGIFALQGTRVRLTKEDV